MANLLLHSTFETHSNKTDLEEITMPSEDVYSDEWWLDRNDHGRCVAIRRNGERCLKPANRGMTVCRSHGGAAPQVKRKALQRIQEAADTVARELLVLATGAESEAVKLNAIRDALDRAGLGAKSEVTVEVKPYEQLINDITGVANISRAEHRALHGRPIIDAALVAPLDVEVVGADPEGDPVRPPERPGDEMRDPGEGDDPGDDMRGDTGGLMTLEDAAEAEWQAGHQSGYGR